MTHDTPPKRIWEFDRYINGVLMAEGVSIEKQPDLASAMKAAAIIASRGPHGEVPVLIVREDASEHAALIREAEDRGWNNGMLTATSIVAEERNKRNPGPLFEVLNKAIGKIDDARFAAIRENKQ